MKKDNKLGLDLSKFKHVKSDKNSTTLQHKDGHILNIAHNVLSPQNKTALQALSKIAGETATEGQKQEEQDQNQYGKVIRKFANGTSAPLERTEESRPPPVDQTLKEKQKVIGDTSSQKGTAIPSAGTMWDRITHPYSEGGKVQKFAEKGLVEKPEVDLEQLNQQLANNPDQVPNAPDKAPVQGIDPISAMQSYPKEGTPEDEIVPSAVEGAIGAGKDYLMSPAGGTAPPPAEAPAPTAVTGQQAPPVAAPDASLAPKTEEKAPPKGEDTSFGGTLEKSLKEQIDSENQRAKALGTQGEANKQALIDNQAAVNKAREAYDTTLGEIHTKVTHLQHDIDEGYIDPDKYWTGTKNAKGETVGGHSRIAAAIGMIIAGFNPTNNPNAAINLLKFNIEQNVKSQTENLGQKNNLLRTMMQEYGNARDGFAAYRLTLADDLNRRLGIAAAEATSPLAKAAALDNQGKLHKEYAPLRRQIEFSQTMQKLANDHDPQTPGAIEHMIQSMEAMGMHEQVKPYKEAFVPGVGLSKSLTPIPEKVREQLIEHQKFEMAAKDLQSFIAGHNTFNPLSADYTIGAQKALALQSLIRENKLGTVYRDSEKPLLETFLTSNPAGVMKMIKTNPQLQELLRSNLRDANILKQNYNLPIQQAQPTIGGAQEGRTGTLPDGTRIKIVNGKPVKI